MRHFKPSSGAGFWRIFGLVVFLVALGGVDLVRSGKPPSTAAGLSNQNRSAAWYFRSGQWRADARTLVAAARWCLENQAAIPNTNPGTALTLPNTNTISRT